MISSYKDGFGLCQELLKLEENISLLSNKIGDNFDI